MNELVVFILKALLKDAKSDYVHPAASAPQFTAPPMATVLTPGTITTPSQRTGVPMAPVRKVMPIERTSIPVTKGGTILPPTKPTLTWKR